MAIHQWPEDERPREKLINHGANTLSNSELLAIFLRSGTVGQNAVELGRSLLEEFGGLAPLLAADCQRFCQHHGVGNATYVQLQAALELGRRYLSEELTGHQVMLNPDHTRRYLASQLRHYPHEVFACLFLDNRHRLIRFEKLFHGTIDQASVYPREVVKHALKYNASALIFAHNHPSGDAEPSQADIALTQRLKQALELVDIRVLDHIIIGAGHTTSVAERGLM
ncbi:MAG: DNA repair protein RadC [Gammaproteobacteria bacterium]|nr:DNA repair protein RadC [Gammaproteobacteria bacterium]